MKLQDQHTDHQPTTPEVNITSLYQHVHFLMTRSDQEEKTYSQTSVLVKRIDNETVLNKQHMSASKSVNK